MNDYIDLIEFKDDIESVGLAIADISVKLSRDKDDTFDWMSSNTRREISDTLSKYADYGRMAVTKARSLPTPVAGQEVLSFRDIQSFLFPKFDYASIVLATNDILKSKNEDSDIRRTLSYALQKYFNIFNMSDIWQIFEMGIKSVHPAETLDVSYFTSIRGNLMTDTSIVGIILKALDASVQACKDTLLVEDMYTFTKLSYIFHEGFVGTAIRMYMMQNWMLGEYVRGFDSEVPVTESTVNDFSSNFRGLSIFAKNTNMDWLNGNLDQFMTTLKSFIDRIGMLNAIDKVKLSDWRKHSFGSAIEKNILYQLIEKYCNGVASNSNRPYIDRCYIDPLNSMFVDDLKAIMEIKSISMDGTTFISPADKMCDIIMSTPCGSTADKIKEFALDLYLFTQILPPDRDIKDYAIPFDKTHINQTEAFNEVRMLGIVHNTFRPIREAIWKRFGMIEEQLNDIYVGEPQPYPYNLDIGDFITTEPQEQSYKKMQYPFVNDAITECYAMPFYIQESLRSEYLATMDAFKDSILFKEDGDQNTDLSDMEGMNNQQSSSSTTQQNSSNNNSMVDATKKTLSNILDKIISLIKGMAQRIGDFIKKQSVAAAIKWVEDHKADLQMIKLADGVTMPEWVVYRNPIKFNFTNRAMMAIAPTDTFAKYQEQLVAFYGDKKVYDWFNGSDSANAPQKYKNYILYNDDGSDPKPQVYSADMVAQSVPIWVNNITSLDDIVNRIEQISGNLINSISTIKTKLSGEKDMSKINEYQNMLNAANKAVTAVVIPTGPIIIDAIMNQYQYIQFVYNNRAGANPSK